MANSLPELINFLLIRLVFGLLIEEHTEVLTNGMPLSNVPSIAWLYLLDWPREVEHWLGYHACFIKADAPDLGVHDCLKVNLIPLWPRRVVVGISIETYGDLNTSKAAPSLFTCSLSRRFPHRLLNFGLSYFAVLGWYSSWDEPLPLVVIELLYLDEQSEGLVLRILKGVATATL